MPASVLASCCDPWRLAAGGVAPEWTARVAGVPALGIGRQPDAVVVTTHLDEDVAAAGGLLRALALQGTDVEVLTVTDGDGTTAAARRAAQERRLRRRRARQTEGYRKVGLPGVRRLRLALPSGALDEHAGDLEAALSELVGHDCYPGMLMIAPWRGDPHPDHAAVGAVAERVAAVYRLRVVRYLAGPDLIGDLPWPRVRRLELSPVVQACKRSALVRPNGTGHGPIADTELYLD